MNVVEYNRSAWDHQVEQGNVWTQPFSAEVIARAKAGDWSLVLTPKKPVPRSWYPELQGADVLGLASGGGQQCPVFAAAGAKVAVFDNSPRQLAQDRAVADREGFDIRTEQGDMRDLSVFDDESFDLIFHPCSNCFCPEIRPVWRECFRVMRPGAVLLVGFTNPIVYAFDYALAQQGTLTVRHALPYSDVGSLPDEERQQFIDANEPLIFGHTLSDQIGGQLDAGLVLTDMFEDKSSQQGPEDHVYDRYFEGYIATRAVKPRV